MVDKVILVILHLHNWTDLITEIFSLFRCLNNEQRSYFNVMYSGTIQVTISVDKKYTFDEEIKGDRGSVQRGTIPDRLLESRPLHDNCAGRIPTMLKKVKE